MAVAIKDMTEAVQLFTQANTIFLYGVIGENPCPEDEALAEKYISDMAFIKALGDIAAAYPDAKIRVNCLGGSVMHGSAMITAIQNCPVPVDIYVDSVAYSKAFNIFMSVPKERRHMSKVATLMCHEVSGNIYGTPQEIEQYAVGLRTMRDGTVQRMADEMGMTKEKIIAQYFDGKDHFFSYADAVKLGLIAADDAESAYDAADVVNQTFAVQEGPLGDDDDDDIMMLNGFRAARALAIQQFSNHNQNSESKMKKEDLAKAIQEGDMTIADVETIVQAEKAKQPLSAEAMQAAIDSAVQSAIAPLLEKITQMAGSTPPGSPAAPNGTDANGGFQAEKTPTQLAEEAIQKVNDDVAKDGFSFDTL